MATCDYCGTTILFGGKDQGGFQFCNDLCAQRGATKLKGQVLPEGEFDKRLRAVHQGRCPCCGGRGPVDVHSYHLVWSALLLTSWRSKTRICCRPCGLRSQLGWTAFSLLLGWWGFPFGLIMTPVQVTRNLAGIFLGPKSGTPSDALKELVMLQVSARGGYAPPPPGATHGIRTTLDGMEGRFQ